MNEAEAYEGLRPHLQSLGLDPQRIENVLSKGTPDVWYAGGAIEMKYLEEWPAFSSTPVRIRTLVDRPQQVAWLWRRWTCGGPAWVMVRIDRQYLLFAAPDARAVRNGLPRERLLKTAVWMTDVHGRGDFQELRSWLLWKDEELPPPQRAKLLRLICNQTVEEAATILRVNPEEVERGETVECLTTNDLIDAWVA